MRFYFLKVQKYMSFYFSEYCVYFYTVYARSPDNKSWASGMMQSYLSTAAFLQKSRMDEPNIGSTEGLV